MVFPMSRIVRFAIATAVRQKEICRVTWNDLNRRTKMLLIRDRKDWRAKKGNDQRIPLLAVSGYDAMALTEDQRAIRATDDVRTFPVITSPSAPGSLGPIRNLRSRIFTFTICGTKELAGCRSGV